MILSTGSQRYAKSSHETGIHGHHFPTGHHASESRGRNASALRPLLCLYDQRRLQDNENSLATRSLVVDGSNVHAQMSVNLGAT